MVKLCLLFAGIGLLALVLMYRVLFPGQQPIAPEGRVGLWLQAVRPTSVHRGLTTSSSRTVASSRWRPSEPCRLCSFVKWILRSMMQSMLPRPLYEASMHSPAGASGSGNSRMECSMNGSLLLLASTNGSTPTRRRQSHAKSRGACHGTCWSRSSPVQTVAARIRPGST